MATVGTIAVEPGAVSVIPGRVRLAIDVRAIAGTSLERIEAAIRGRAAEIAARRDVGAEVALVRSGQPVELDRGLAATALRTAQGLGIPATETWSGAGHDAQHLAALAPTLLLFVPLHGGESHTPQEAASMDEIVQAATVATQTLLTAGTGCETTTPGARDTTRP